MLKGHFIWCHKVLEPELLLIGGVIETHFPFWGLMKPFPCSFTTILFPKLRKKLTTIYFHSDPVPMSKAKIRSSVELQAPKAFSFSLYSIQWFSTPCMLESPPCMLESPKMTPQRLWLYWAGQVLLVCKSLPGDSNLWSELRAMCLTGSLSGIL